MLVGTAGAAVRSVFLGEVRRAEERAVDVIVRCANRIVAHEEPSEVQPGPHACVPLEDELPFPSLDVVLDHLA